MEKNESSLDSEHVNDVGSNEGSLVQNQMIDSINSMNSLNLSNHSSKSNEENENVTKLGQGFPKSYSSSFQEMIKIKKNVLKNKAKQLE